MPPSPWWVPFQNLPQLQGNTSHPTPPPRTRPVFEMRKAELEGFALRNQEGLGFPRPNNNIIKNITSDFHAKIGSSIFWPLIVILSPAETTNDASSETKREEFP